MLLSFADMGNLRVKLYPGKGFEPWCDLDWGCLTHVFRQYEVGFISENDMSGFGIQHPCVLSV